MAVPAAQSVSHATPFDRSELVRKVCSNKTTLDNSKILQTIFTIFLYSSLIIKTSIVYHVQTFKSFVEKYIDINHIQFLMFSNNANNDLSSPSFNICHVISYYTISNVPSYRSSSRNQDEKKKRQ